MYIYREELGMYPHETNRDTRKSKWCFSARNMQRRRLPSVFDRAAWKKITKRHTTIAWAKVVKGVGKEIGGRQDETMSTNECGRNKT